MTGHLRAQNTNGGGTGIIIFHNNREIGREKIAGNDDVGIYLTKLVRNLQVGDTVDLALTPENLDGSRHDGSDGSFFRLFVDEFVAPPVPILSPFGLIALAALLMAGAAWMLQRRLIPRKI